MRRNSGELQNFISDKIQIWARVVLKMLLTGIKVQKWSKVTQKRLSYCKIPYFGVLCWFHCFTPPFGHMRNSLRPKKGPVWPINLPYWPHSSKSSQTYWVSYQNLCEKGTKPIKKAWAQSDLSIWRKTKQHCRLPILESKLQWDKQACLNCPESDTFLKNCIFGWF